MRGGEDGFVLCENVRGGGVSRENKKCMRRWLLKMYCRTLGSGLDSAGVG